jgi:hypothetical protein
LPFTLITLILIVIIKMNTEKSCTQKEVNYGTKEGQVVTVMALLQGDDHSEYGSGSEWY